MADVMDADWEVGVIIFLLIYSLDIVIGNNKMTVDMSL